jgi:hypothetical protein
MIGRTIRILGFGNATLDYVGELTLHLLE